MSRLPATVSLACLLFGASACRPDIMAEREQRAPIELAPNLPAPQPLPRGGARYALTAHLDAASHEVRGSGTISWTNRSDRPVDVLYLHLYMNAFQKGSLFLRNAGGRSGGLVGREGRIDVRRLTSTTFGGRDLWQNAAAHSPDDPADRTDIRVPLPGTIAPGGVLELEVEFLTVLPEIVERTGYSEDYHFVAQWFPKLARLEEDGTWAHFSFHPFAEFYADFDDYEVTLDVPGDHRVGATGRVDPASGGMPGRARYVARASSVVDFAWTSSPHLSVEERQLGPTLVRVLFEEPEPRVRRAHWATLQTGLSELGRWLGTYPYPELTVVIPPAHAERSGGMEYPTIMTTGGGETAARLGLRVAELLVIHELSHQWFQSLVATNEAEYPMLDEGLASYAEWRFLQSQYGSASLAEALGLRLSRTAGGRFAAFFGRTTPIRINQPAREFPSFAALAREVYGRTPLVLETLGRTFGRERVDSAVAAYARTFRGAHPTPQDFYGVLAAYLGEDKLPLIISLFDEPAHYNLGVQSLTSDLRQDGILESTLVVRRDGGPGLPFEVAVQFVNGRRQMLRGSGQLESERLSFRHTEAIRAVYLDPEERLLLDENPADDAFDPRTHGPLDVSADAVMAALTSGLTLLSFGLSP